MQCQKVYLRNGYCKQAAFGASKWCRWHKIIEEFRRDLQKRPQLFAQVMMFGSSMAASGAVYCGWMAAHPGNVAWSLLAILLAGSSAKFFADGCISQDHPFAQFALWGKLLAIGLVIEIGSGTVAGFYLVQHPSEASEIVRHVTSSEFWLKYGPSLLAAASFLTATMSARLFLNRILFLRRPGLDYAIGLLTLVTISYAAQPMLQEVVPWQIDPVPPAQVPEVPAPPQTPPKDDPRGIEEPQNRLKGFLHPAIGDTNEWAPIILYMVGFALDEFLNKRVRTRGQAMAVFRVTVWPSFPICVGSAFLGMLASRYILVWIELQSAWVFGIASIALTAVFVILGTRILVRSHLASLGPASATDPEPPRGRRQELLLFLKLSKPLGSGGLSDRIQAQTLFEIELALKYSATGLIEDIRPEGDFIVIQMAGDSAERIFGSLRELLHSITLHPGSFVVLRYGGAGQGEKVIEL